MSFVSVLVQYRNLKLGKSNQRFEWKNIGINYMIKIKNTTKINLKNQPNKQTNKQKNITSTHKQFTSMLFLSAPIFILIDPLFN